MQHRQQFRQRRFGDWLDRIGIGRRIGSEGFGRTPVHSDPNQALATQLANIQKKTGRTLAELTELVRGSGLAKHGEIVAMLKQTLGLGHGDANTLAHAAKQPPEDAPGPVADPLDTLYTGKRAALRPIHEALLAAVRGFGEFEAAPKQGYISYRRRKQFATIGPATQTQIEIGLNAKGLEAGERLQTLPAGQMCNYKLRIGAAEAVDAELIGWLRAAWDAAG